MSSPSMTLNLDEPTDMKPVCAYSAPVLFQEVQILPSSNFRTESKRISRACFV